MRRDASILIAAEGPVGLAAALELGDRFLSSFGTVIAVNAAARHLEADWYAAGDSKSYLAPIRWRPGSTGSIWCAATVQAQVEREAHKAGRPRPEAGAWRSIETAAPAYHQLIREGIDWKRFSMTQALVLAGTLLGELEDPPEPDEARVVLVGVDWEGARSHGEGPTRPDCVESLARQRNRTPQRWADEARIARGVAARIRSASGARVDRLVWDGLDLEPEPLAGTAGGVL